MPSAVRRKENTIASRIKLVITSMSEGAKISSVKTTTTFSEVTSWAGLSGALRDRFTVGMVVGAALIRLGINAKMLKKSRIKMRSFRFDFGCKMFCDFVILLNVANLSNFIKSQKIDFVKNMTRLKQDLIDFAKSVKTLESIKFWQAFCATFCICGFCLDFVCICVSLSG